MKKVLLINSVIYLPGEGGYKRTLFLFDYLAKFGYDVTLLTSDFNHYAKKKRNVDLFRKNYPSYNNIEFLKLDKYEKNISLKRFLSELKYKKVVTAWVNSNIQRFDVVYVSMPEIPTILGIRNILDNYKIPLIIDVRDLRPEAFKVFLKNEILYKILTFWMKFQANKAYASADELIAVSREYLDRGISVNRNSVDPKVVYIGSVIEKFDEGVEKYKNEIYFDDEDFILIYSGTLGESYDLETILLAMEKLQKNPLRKIKLVILGQGPSEKKLRNICFLNKINNVEFIGFVDYEKMASYLSKSSVAINAIKSRASQSIINKVADYLAAGIPILSSSLKKEMKNIIIDNNVGLNYIPEDVEGLVSSIEYLYDNPDLCNKMGRNARLLAEDQFDRKKSYLDIIKTINSVRWNKKE
jgi:glycosyltransferase involved in cell wall biosynthesis